MSELTLERLKELYSYDPATGVFTRLKARNNTKPGPLRTRDNGEGYLRLYIDGRRYKQHRLAVFYMTGRWPDGPVDHAEGCERGNGTGNLRVVTPRANAENRRRAHKNSSTGFLGVSTKRRKDGTPRYIATITTAGRTHFLGSFPTPEAAHAAYVSAKRQLHVANTL